MNNSSNARSTDQTGHSDEVLAIVQKTALVEVGRSPGPFGSEPEPSDKVSGKAATRRLVVLLTGLLAIVAIVAGVGYSFMPRASPEAVVKKYLEAPRWEDRLPFVRNPEKVRPLMAKIYKAERFPKSYLEIKPIDKRDLDRDLVDVRVVFSRGKNAFGGEVEDANWYVLKNSPQGYLIDWEASIGYQPMTAAAFKVQRPEDPLKFRVLAKMGNYYWQEFYGKEKILYSVDLTVGRWDAPESSLTGYIPKITADGQKLYEILKDGEQHAVIVNIYCHHGAYDCGNVVIDKVVQEGWVEE